MTGTLAYALAIIIVIALAAVKERNVAGQLSRELLKFLINQQSSAYVKSRQKE